MSTTHKHTPGPWQYAKGHAPHFQTVVWPEGDGRAIATCYDDETEANARLIASAPELVQALNAALEIMQIVESYYMHDTHNSDPDRLRAAIRQSRAAIAKATAE